jgi:hypothetical protein
MNTGRNGAWFVEQAGADNVFVHLEVVSRKLWKFSGVALRAFEGLFFQAARSRGIGSIG